MSLIGILESMFFNRRKSKMKKKWSQMMVASVTFLLWISPGLAADRPPECKPEDFGFCVSPCAFVRSKCATDNECSMDLCSYLYPICHPQVDCPRFLHACWDVLSGCTDTTLHSDTLDRNANKRSILNKNVAYLLFKLHPFLNQTSQFGFLTSGRIRRITGNFGTEFLGKRSNNERSGGDRASKPKIRPTSSTTFYSLPLNKFAKAKILKRDFDMEPRGKRITVRGNGRVIVGSEFLGKRGGWRVVGGKRNPETFDGSEFLGKRTSGVPLGTEFLGKRDEDPLIGSELLGKKSSRDAEYPGKMFGNELLGKRYTGNELLGKKNAGPASEGSLSDYYDPELIDEAFYNYKSFQDGRLRGRSVCDSFSLNAGLCGRSREEEESRTNESE